MQKLLTGWTNNPMSKWFLLITWIAVQSLLLMHFGIVTELEADKYITQARAVLETGRLETSHYLFYAVQISLLLICLKLHSAWWLAWLAQTLLSGYATLAFFKFIERSAGKVAAWLIILLWIINIPLQTFNVYLQTESIFISLTLLFLIRLLSASGTQPKNYLPSLLLLLILCFTRPTGLLLIPSLYIFIFFRKGKKWKLAWKTTYWVLGAVVVTFFANLVLGSSSGGSWDFMLPFETNQIICGVPRSTRMAFDNAYADNSMQGIFYFIYKNPDVFFVLAGQRLVSFIGLQRSYYSAAHNLYLASFFFPLYALAIWGTVRKIVSFDRVDKLLLWSVVILFAATAMLTCDDWHNRLTLCCMPAIYILASAAIGSNTFEQRDTVEQSRQ